MRILILVLLLVFVPAAHGATVGAMPPAGAVGFSAGNSAITLIDLSRPATEAASLTTATVRWSFGPAPGCAAAFKIKFLRPSNVSPAYNVFAERGPFNAANGTNVVTLTPAVSVQPGDVIAITQLNPFTTCGGVIFSFASGEGVTYTTSNSDPPLSSAVADSGLGREYILNARASTSADVIEGYLPGVGSTQGGFGSNFKTGMQLSNAENATITGRLVFHPAGAPASPADPFLAFSIPPGATVAYADVVAAMGRTGQGSIDIVTTNSYPPIVTTRVFNDAGTAGTSGITLDVQTVYDALRRNHFGEITTPADVTNLRFNIGVLTLGEGATINITARDQNGSDLSVSLTRTYPPNYFEQRSAADFIGRTSLPANAVINVSIAAGSAILYGATTDNRTNDPNVKFFTRY